MVSGYGLAAFSSAEERRKNENLKQRIGSLEKFVSSEKEIMSRLIRYEDNARLKYGMTAVGGDVRQAGTGGFPSREDMLYASMPDPLIMRAEALRREAEHVLRQAQLQESTFVQTSQKVKSLHDRWTKRPSVWPANGRITSGYGYRYHPVLGLRLMHAGIDIANEAWTPIFATADGQVSGVHNWPNFGNLVKINHLGGEYITFYAHLHKAAVVSGQVVKRGELLGYMGNSGRSTGTHLHYEVHKNGRPVNPMRFILPTDQIVD
jgi:murein DD-endopeptidase MepM/ murein hydrolase activator NlpD